MSGTVGLRIVFVLLASYAAADVLANPPTDKDLDLRIERVVEEYCTAISDVAAERRMAVQTRALTELENRVEGKIAELEKRKSEFEMLLKRLEDIRSLARKELVDIYAGMEAESAAVQLEQLDLRLAASVIQQLTPRQASSILNEMNPERAAGMARFIAATAERRMEKP